MKVRAGSRPPTSSMTMWTLGAPRTWAASPVSGRLLRSSPSRGRVRSVSAMAASVSRAPARSSSIARRVWRILTTPAPTVPSPSRPMRTSLTRLTRGSSSTAGSAAQILEPAQRLTDALLVLHERETNVAFAVLAEADTRRDRDLRFLNEELRELQRAEAAEGFGDRRPHEHCALRLGHAPAELVEAVHQHVTAFSMDLDDLLDALLVGLERHDAGDLDRLEGAVVEVRLDAGEGADHTCVAADEPKPPPRHVVRFRGREDLDADLSRAGYREERRRLVAVEREVGVREIVNDHQPVLARKVDDLHEELAVHAHRGRIVRERQDEQLGLGPREPRRLL